MFFLHSAWSQCDHPAIVQERPSTDNGLRVLFLDQANKIRSLGGDEAGSHVDLGPKGLYIMKRWLTEISTFTTLNWIVKWLSLFQTIKYLETQITVLMDFPCHCIHWRLQCLILQAFIYKVMQGNPRKTSSIKHKRLTKYVGNWITCSKLCYKPFTTRSLKTKQTILQ